MKDLIHFEEHKEAIRKYHRHRGLKLASNGSGTVLKVKRINPYYLNPTKGQEELYKYFKRKSVLKEEIHETDIFEIFKKYSSERSSWRHSVVSGKINPEVDDQRIYHNYNNFIKRAIGSLVVLNWFGLTFKKEIENIV